MNVICSKTGTRDTCSTCDHSKEHQFAPLKGCECGRCLPDMDIANTISGEIMPTKQFYPCVEVPEIIK